MMLKRLLKRLGKRLKRLLKEPNRRRLQPLKKRA
jgi:hypothetical protein